MYIFIKIHVNISHFFKKYFKSSYGRILFSFESLFSPIIFYILWMIDLWKLNNYQQIFLIIDIKLSVNRNYIN
ncbi:conserved hypothetical protein [Ureaplasma urealyticum serovar 5 str. ATCC 27817]|nr:conserved hypothetical protein [Ureaplasma urealyticum serovar 5 str. ATCC 27817]